MDEGSSKLKSGTIGGEMAANRARLFVGRGAEIEAFDRLISGGTRVRVLFLHGPGGIGKSTLLHALEARAIDRGFAVTTCDARNAPADPAVVRPMLDATLAAAGAVESRPTLLMLDTFEEWAAIEGWLRDEYLASLPATTRVVIAGRRPPGLRWRTDPGWYGVLERAELRPFTADECREYLRRRSISATDFEAAAVTSRGQPLLLALIADAIEASPQAVPARMPERGQVDELLVELAEHLAPVRPSAAERAALYLSALARRTSEPLIEEVLGVDRARATWLFEWLQGLSFIEAGSEGIFPHDVMRLALRASLERRESALRIRLLDAAVDYHLDRLDDHGAGAPDILLDNFYLFTSFMPRLFTDAVLAEEPSYAERARPEHVAALRATVERNAGAEGLALFDFWWREQPSAVRVVRGAEGELRGTFVFLELVEPPDTWLEADRIVARLWAERDHLARPWRTGEDVAVFLRAWTHGTIHMGPSPVGALWSLEMARATMANPHVALGAALHPDSEGWLANSALYGHRELAGSRGIVGDQRVVVTCHDFSRESTKAWLQNTYRRFRDGVGVPISAPRVEPAVLRAALRNLHRPDRLSGHPLLARLDGHDRAAALRELVAAECAALRANPRTEVLGRVLDRTYLRPAADQRAAAEVCQLSWDQYRRGLTEAIKVLAARLSSSLR